MHYELWITNYALCIMNYEFIKKQQPKTNENSTYRIRQNGQDD